MWIKIRNKFWDWLLRISRHPEASMLSWKLIVARIILFPLDTLYWCISNTRGYQWYNDVWVIEGVKYTGTLMRHLSCGGVASLKIVSSTAYGELTFKIVKRENGIMTIEMVKMTSPRTKTCDLIHALSALSVDIQSTDGVANAAILEGAQRIEEFHALLKECLPHVQAGVQAEHMLSGLGPRKRLPIDDFSDRLNSAIKF